MLKFISYSKRGSSRRASKPTNRGLTSLICWLLFLPVVSPAQDWVSQVRNLAGAKNFAAARAILEHRLAASPNDMEAVGWRGRVNAWDGKWAQAERDYRRVLEAVPQEAEIMLALGDVLAWQQRLEEALAYVDRSIALVKGTPLEAEALVRRARLLRRLGSEQEARAAFRETLRLDPANREAADAMRTNGKPPRNEVRIGFDHDRFNYTDAAQIYSVSLRTELSSRWVANGSVMFFNRFGERPVRASGSLTYRATRQDAFTIGGAGAHHQGIIPRNEMFVDYNRGVRVAETSLVRGMEVNYAQRWLWFRDARILALTPSVLLYLPRDWTFSVQGTAARSRFSGTAAEWRPAGSVRLTFPVHRTVALNTFFAVGTENFARADQVGRFSARTWGGGARWNFALRQDVSFYAAYQDRSQGRTQASFGVSYGFRF